MILIPDLFGSYVKGQEEAIKANWSDLENFDAVSKTMRENALGDAMQEGNLADAGLSNIMSTTKYGVADARREEIARLLGGTADYNIGKQGYDVQRASGQLATDQSLFSQDQGVYAGGRTANNQLATYNQGNLLPNAMDAQGSLVATVGANTAAANTSTVASQNAAQQIPANQAFLDVGRNTALFQQDQSNDQYRLQEAQAAQQMIEAKRQEIINAQQYINNIAQTGGPNADSIIRTQQQNIGLMVQDLKQLQINLQQIQQKPAAPSAQQQYTNLLGQ